MRFNCKSCETSLKFSEKLAGRRARCPRCQAVQVLPKASRSEVAAPSRKIAKRKTAKSKTARWAPLAMAASLALVFVMTAGGTAYWLHGKATGSKADIAAITRYLPAETQAVSVINVDAVMAAKARASIEKVYPGWFEEAERLKNAGVARAVTGSYQPPGTFQLMELTVCHLHENVDEARLKSLMRLGNMQQEFRWSKTKVNKCDFYSLGKEIPLAYGIADQRTILYGNSDLVKKALEQGQQSQLTPELKALLGGIDLDGAGYAKAVMPGETKLVGTELQLYGGAKKGYKEGTLELWVNDDVRAKSNVYYANDEEAERAQQDGRDLFGDMVEAMLSETAGKAVKEQIKRTKHGNRVETNFQLNAESLDKLQSKSLRGVVPVR